MRECRESKYHIIIRISRITLFYFFFFCLVSQYAFEVAALSAFGEIMEHEMEEIKDLYRRLENGYNSFAIYFPGTPYWKSMKVKTTSYPHQSYLSYILTF